MTGLTYYCWRCYAEHARPAGPCTTCGGEIEAPAGTTYVEQLRWALRHPLRERRSMAAHALGLRGERRAVDDLSAVVQDDPDSFVAADALEALVRLLDDDAALATAQRFAGDARLPVRAMSDRLLARLTADGEASAPVLYSPRSRSVRKEIPMSPVIRAALVQAHANMPKEEALEKQSAMLEEAAAAGAQIACLQEIFFGPYFCAEQDPKWFATAEPDDGPTVQAMRELAKKHSMVLVVPFFEKALEGVYYNTAIVIEADGTVLGKYRKTHIPQVGPIFWEKYFFKPGNLGYPVFDTSVGKVGVFICYDRHFPEPARLLGLAGAQLTFNPSATIESLSRYLWELEQPAHAVANGFFVGAINRVGEELVEGARFYGSSYFCDPRGQIIAQASDTNDEVLVADLDLSMVEEVRTLWQFYRDRRPETYHDLAALLP